MVMDCSQSSQSIDKSLGSHFKAQKYDMIVAESFLRSLIKNYGKHTVYTDRWWNMVS
jgi:hypothetical protein